MSVSWIVLLGCVLFFAWRGYQAGVGSVLQRIVSLACGYGAAFVFTVPFAEVVEANTRLQGAASFIASSVLVFFGVALLVNIVIALSMRLVLGKGREPIRSAGALSGTFIGVFIGLLLVWLVGTVKDALLLQDGTEVADTKEDLLQQTASNMVGGMVKVALDTQVEENSPLPDMAAKLIKNPVKVGDDLSRIVGSEDFRNLFTDEHTRDLMSAGKIKKLESTESFEQLLQQPGARDFLVTMSREYQQDGVSEEAAVAMFLSNIWQTADALQNDARFQKMTEDPEVKKILEDPDPMALLTNPKLKELGEIVADLDMEAYREQHNDAAPGSHRNSASSKPVEKKTIYRWRDEQGQLHYSEHKPADKYQAEKIQ